MNTRFRRLAVTARAVARIPHLPAFLPEADAVVLDPWPGADTDAVAGWGDKPSSQGAQAAARRRGIPYIALEDGFLRSVSLGQAGAPPMSLVADRQGIYFDASRPSDLETSILSGGGDVSQARDAIAFKNAHRLSKYNAAPPLDLGIKTRRRVLVIDQTAGDASIAGALADAASFARMLDAARSEDAEIVVKVHPATAGGYRRGCIEMVQQALDIFGIVPDHNLSVMRPDQTLSSLTAAVIAGMDSLLVRLAPSRIVVHGDTSTAMAASIAAFHRGVAVGHVEAGLRTGNLDQPYPEEFNRRCIDLTADLLWAPTELARDNLLAEALPQGKRVIVTGNTVVDALQWAVARLQADTALRQSVRDALPALDPAKRLVLVTGHRRESFGGGFETICEALRALAARGDVEIVYPVHLNPNVTGPVRKILGGIPNVHLIAPQGYFAFVDLMNRSHLILTDSGGVQEEAPSLDKPVLVMRDVTERPEAVAAGTARLVGTGRDAIVGGVSLLLDDDSERDRMISAKNPYGDGQASARIVASLLAG